MYQTKYFVLILWILCGNFLSCDKNNTPASGTPKSIEPLEKETGRVFLWIDAKANWVNLSTVGGIRSYVAKAKGIGVTDFVLDVKGTSGEVLYNSTIAPKQTTCDGITRPRDFDYVGLFIEEAHKNDIKVQLFMNVFSGGRTGNIGIIYSDPDKAIWQSMCYDKDGVIRKSTESLDFNGNVMLNVSRKDVRDYELSIMEELAKKYPKADGIGFDRCRWDSGLRGDYSDESRGLFEAYIGHSVANFPKDIFEWITTTTPVSYTTNKPLFPIWNEWRCSIIYNFIKEAKDRLKAIDSNMEFCDYVGAWYGSYYDVGVNWASNRYSTYSNSSYQFFSTPAYYKYGYAQLLDVLMTGNYSYKVSLEEGAWSVEGLANTANTVTMDDTKVYAGLYLYDYIRSGQMDTAQMRKAIEMCFKKSKGVMLFDVIYLEKYSCWAAAKSGIRKGRALKN